MAEYINCPAGYGASNDTASMGTCAGCLAGTYSLENDNWCHSCDAGRYSIAYSEVCEDCPRNTYSSEMGSSNCAECDAGRVRSIVSF